MKALAGELPGEVQVEAARLVVAAAGHQESLDLVPSWR